jgi:hypothetical protein
MAIERQKRVLIYRRTHEGDPDEKTGIFGNSDCMGRVRSWDFSAVIGIGGIRPWPAYKHITRKLTWIGIGKHSFKKLAQHQGPRLAFDHFKYFYGEDQKLLKEIAPMLARHMYEEYKCARAPLLVDESSQFWPEVTDILDLARDAPPSAYLKGVPLRSFQETSSKCRSTSC